MQQTRTVHVRTRVLNLPGIFSYVNSLPPPHTKSAIAVLSLIAHPLYSEPEVKRKSAMACAKFVVRCLEDDDEEENKKKTGLAILAIASIARAGHPGAEGLVRQRAEGLIARAVGRWGERGPVGAAAEAAREAIADLG